MKNHFLWIPKRNLLSVLLVHFFYINTYQYLVVEQAKIQKITIQGRHRAVRSLAKILPKFLKNVYSCTLYLVHYYLYQKFCSVLLQVNGNCGEALSCGIIARSAGIFENAKRICACDGVTLWDERNKPLVGPGRQQQRNQL